MSAHVSLEGGYVIQLDPNGGLCLRCRDQGHVFEFTSLEICDEHINGFDLAANSQGIPSASGKYALRISETAIASRCG